MRPTATYYELLALANQKQEEAKRLFQRRILESNAVPTALPATASISLPLDMEEEENWGNPLSPKCLNIPKATPQPTKETGPLDNAFFTGGRKTPLRTLETPLEPTKGPENAYWTPPVAPTDFESRGKSAPPAREIPSLPVVKIAPSVYFSAAKNWRTEQSWSARIRALNQIVFRNATFRENQEEIINAALANQDVFVCMPTGGGKSLTFQISAQISVGLTLVVMPLLSLIQDQIVYLRSLCIRVQQFNSSQSQAEQVEIYQQIERDTELKLLYLTPEKLAQSDRLSGLLGDLYRAGRLARLVIDEAHCVSKWGRDFRADYLKLSTFRQRFPKVPIMALTATATDKVKEDVMKVLSMRSPSIFLSSFNRPNLTFTVRPKPKDAIADIADFIHSRHSNQTGLIYCISTKDCERVAKELKKLNIHCGYYHAKMQTEKRIQTQEKWMKEQIRVLAATVAFGMGINKANVRFVIHFSLPKSLENYYQEAGRAGRDGNPADCVLYYTYGDKLRQDYLIHKSGSRGEAHPEGANELNLIIRYCEDIFNCRRKLQLAHFGEEFDARFCNKTCDNCIAMRVPQAKDLTEPAVAILKVFEGNRQGLNTLLQIVNLLKGGNSKPLEGLKYHECFGLLKHMARDDIERLMHQLVYEEVLKEITVKNFKGFNTNVQLGPKARDLLSARLRIIVLYEKKGKVSMPMRIEEAAAASQDLTILERDELQKIEDEELIPKLESLAYQRFPQLPKTVDPANLSVELAAELKERLLLVRNKLAKRQNRPPQEVMADAVLEQLSKSIVMPAGVLVPKEIQREIEYFAETNDLHAADSEAEVVIEDSSDEEFVHPFSLKRKREDGDRLSEKRVKQS